MALAGKMDQKDYRVYAVLGDGEVEEGQVWEAFMSAAKYKLDNLCAVIDVNGLQIDGKTADVMPTEPLDQKLQAFGWNVIPVNGHDMEALSAAFAQAKDCEGCAHHASGQDGERQGGLLHGEPGGLARQGPPMQSSMNKPARSWSPPWQKRRGSNMAEKIATRAAYGKALVEFADQEPNLVVLDADLSGSTMTKDFGATHPDRFFDMGIAEANMVGVAAGLATCREETLRELLCHVCCWPGLGAGAQQRGLSWTECQGGGLPRRPVRGGRTAPPTSALRTWPSCGPSPT